MSALSNLVLSAPPLGLFVLMSHGVGPGERSKERGGGIGRQKFWGAMDPPTAEQEDRQPPLLVHPAFSSVSVCVCGGGLGSLGHVLTWGLQRRLRWPWSNVAPTSRGFDWLEKAPTASSDLTWSRA